MSELHIELTPEELQEFSNMSVQEKKEFMESADNRRKQLMLKTVVLTSVLVESFDELEYFKMTRYKTKHSVKNAKKHLEKYINDVYNVNVEEELGTEYISQISKEIDKLL